MGKAQSDSAAGRGPFTTPTPSSTESMISLRSMAMHMAWRTRTSLNGFWSVRIEMSLTTFDANSAILRVGRVWRGGP